jgi:hypothetical protein
MSGFRRGRRGVAARFSERERALLIQLLGEVGELLGSEQPGAKTPDLPESASGPAAAGAEPDPLEALVGAMPEAVEAPRDPALARLLPDGYSDDPEASAELRRYTESELRAGKAAAARTALAWLRDAGEGSMRLDDETAQAFLAALNDVRLVLGTRLDVTEETYAELAQLSRGDPRYGPLAVYDWLTGLQESLVGALARW